MMKIALYIHGRPSGHPIHDSYARAIESTFLPEDFLVPYLLEKSQNKFLRYCSWILNAVYLTLFKRNYDLVLTESVRVPLFIASRWMMFPSHIQKVALMADESLYFTYTKKYPRMTLWLMKQYFLEMDYLICIGAYQEELAKKILPITHHHKIKKIFNGLSEEKMSLLQKNSPNFEGNRWIFVGNINVPFRVYYKGIDLLLESLSMLDESMSWSIDIVGDCPIEIQQDLLRAIPESIHTRIRFLGVQHIESIISNYNLCIHVARGDSYPTSVIEMMAAGIPTLVSVETGTKEIVEQIDPSYVVPLSAPDIAEKIRFYVFETIENKIMFSEKCKQLTNKYTSKIAKKLFAKEVDEILNK